jgi:hypothetical protein
MNVSISDDCLNRKIDIFFLRFMRLTVRKTISILEILYDGTISFSKFLSSELLFSDGKNLFWTEIADLFFRKLKKWIVKNNFDKKIVRTLRQLIFKRLISSIFWIDNNIYNLRIIGEGDGIVQRYGTNDSWKEKIRQIFIFWYFPRERVFHTLIVWVLYFTNVAYILIIYWGNGCWFKILHTDTKCKWGVL